MHKLALLHLSRNDKVMARLISQIKIQPLRTRSNHFQALVESIISQQLSTAAAETIAKRFLLLFGGKNFPKPEQVLKVSNHKFRQCGLSFAKIAYIKNLSLALKNKELNFRRLSKSPDEEIIQALTKIKGIGRWTAEMFLIFSLNRPDIFSIGDLGLRNAIRKLYKIDAYRHPRKLEKLLNTWKPYRSLASRHLWASLDS